MFRGGRAAGPDSFELRAVAALLPHRRQFLPQNAQAAPQRPQLRFFTLKMHRPLLRLRRTRLQNDAHQK